MEAVILIGLQASGKSSFCRRQFFDSHVRINLDMLRTRRRERVLTAACQKAKQSYVIDSTNPSRSDRVDYIETAKSAGFRVVGYYFASKIEDCKIRNSRRRANQQVPVRGLLGTYNRLELPSFDEGFDQLYYVSMNPEAGFTVSDWNDEV